jgi:uncharacterized protein YjbI with pentapeptide repeats
MQNLFFANKGWSCKTSIGSDHFLKPKKKDLQKILNEHSIWVLSLGKVGQLADVKNWKLDKTNLKMANLPFAKLHFVSLRGSNLSGINFRQADLLKCSLIDADLDGADLEGANLSEGDLSFSKCMGANFADANLEGANFEGANLKETNFTRAILRGANFKEADLSSSEMIDANLEDANFEGAKLSGANFGGANLDKANFEKTDLRGLNIANTNLLEADDEGTKLTDSIRKQKKSSELGSNNHRLDKTTPSKKPRIKSSKEDLFVDSNAVNPDMLEKAVTDLIEKVKSNIQLDQIKAICKNQHGIEKIDKIDCTHGDIVTHNDQIAFRLDFKVSYNLSLLLDRHGDFIKKGDSKA